MTDPRIPQLATIGDLLREHYGEEYRPLRLRGWVGLLWWRCPLGNESGHDCRQLATVERTGQFVLCNCGAGHDEATIREHLGAVVA